MSLLSDMLMNLSNGGSSQGVPQTAARPNFIPEDTIGRQYRLADTLRHQPQGSGNSWAGIIGNGIRTVGGNMIQGDTNNAVRSNADLRKQSIENLANANDPSTLSTTMLQSPVPEIQELGLKTHIQQVTDDPTKEYRIRAAQAVQNGMKPGTPEFRSFVLAGQLPAPKDPLDQEYKRAQIEKLQKVDPVDALVANMLGPQPQSGVPASSPTSPQAPSAQPPMLLPQNFDGVAPNSPNNPLLINVADTRVSPAGAPTQAPMQPTQAAPSASPSAPSPSDMIDTPFGRMSRGDATRKGAALTLSPKYAAAGKALLDAASSGVGGPNELSKPAQTKLDERTISAASTLGRLHDIRAQFKPEFQTLGGKLKMAGASWGSFLGPDIVGKMAPETTKTLQEFAAYKATAFDNFNQLLKELSGTAVSAQELARQKIVQPNPGEGIFDGDDPITFQSKIDQGEKIARSAIARMNFMRSKGLQFNKDTAEQFLRLEDVPAAIDARGAEIEQQLRRDNPNVDPMKLEQAVKKQLGTEFGI